MLIHLYQNQDITYNCDTFISLVIYPLIEMFLSILVFLLVLYIVHLSIKYVWRPYMRMRQFKGIKDVYILDFVPLIGAFYLAEKSFK